MNTGVVRWQKLLIVIDESSYLKRALVRGGIKFLLSFESEAKRASQARDPWIIEILEGWRIATNALKIASVPLPNATQILRTLIDFFVMINMYHGIVALRPFITSSQVPSMQ